ncbi:hypothetical protein [Flavobacterium terrisoli]|uniref:hypothetical protein n=1 Tax=Flavobacterium terrisoli TaxID=3242195 RepID=UPI0025435943|nr:hypothetical protein [Flavobacterium buctense]
MVIDKYKVIKWAVIVVSIVSLILLIIFTCDIINDEPNWAWFDIDFDNQKVSNYGTLISGLLSFLAILFVIFSLADQREQLKDEKEEQKLITFQEYNSRLKLIKSLLINMLAEIKLQGERMEIFYTAELKNPAQSNVTYFSANNSFKRILELDSLINYKTIEHFFKDDADWEKMYINMYNYVDFYSASLDEHKVKYQGHIEDKVARQKEVSELCREFLKIGGELMEKYRSKFGPDNYLNHSWPNAYNDFVPAYYTYADECATQQKQTDFRFLSDNFFLTFLKIAMVIREKEGFDEYGSENLVVIASDIRKKIYEIEMYSIQYADNIKHYFVEYFDTKSESFKSFDTIVNKIDSKIVE